MSLSPFTLRVIEIVKAIPRGKVMTYGLVAEQAGNRRAARQVVRILHTQTRKHGLPWYRIVNAGEKLRQGRLARAEQAALLREEGVEVDQQGRMNLEQYLYFHPHN